MTTESGHWYKRNGQSCHQVPNSTGGMRDVNLRWDRKLGLVPSVTGILSVLNKPGLNRWKEEQIMLASLTMPRLENEPELDYIQRIREDANAQIKRAADEGSAIHNAIECHFKGKDYDESFKPFVQAALIELNELFPDVRDWVAEKSFAHESGFGGCVDLHSPSTGIICDFKTKDSNFSDGKKLAYDQNIQLSAYGIGLELPPADCANIFISRTHPGVAKGHKWDKKQIKEAGKIFMATLELWKLVKKYDPSFKRK